MLVRIASSVLLAVCILNAASAAQARVIVTERSAFYAVEGASSQAIIASLDKNAPLVLKDGRRFYAKTARALTWSYDYKERSRSCAVAGVRVMLDLVYTTPRWRPSRGAERALLRQWNAFEKAVRRHEKGHGAIAKKSARRLAREIKRTRTQPTCAALDAAVRQRVAAFAEKGADGRAAHERYDRRTGHGVRQGAHFGPPR